MSAFYIRGLLLMSVCLFFMNFKPSACAKVPVEFNIANKVKQVSMLSPGFYFNEFQIKKTHADGRVTIDEWICYDNECWGVNAEGVVTKTVSREVVFIGKIEKEGDTNVLRKLEDTSITHPTFGDDEGSNVNVEFLNEKMVDAPASTRPTFNFQETAAPMATRTNTNPSPPRAAPRAAASTTPTRTIESRGPSPPATPTPNTSAQSVASRESKGSAVKGNAKTSETSETEKKEATTSKSLSENKENKSDNSSKVTLAKKNGDEESKAFSQKTPVRLVLLMLVTYICSYI